MRTLIIDDEPLAVERLQIMCAQIHSLQLVGTASDGGAALRLTHALAPDLLLLDIGMPGLDGIGVAAELAKLEARPQVIFVTAFDQFAVAAFDVAAVDYLLKPIDLDRLKRAVGRAAERRHEKTAPGKQSPWIQEFWIPHRAEIVRVAAAEIELIEAERDYMRLHLGSRSFLLHQTITALEQRLDPDLFIRLHRSTIVRRDQIAGFKRDEAGGWVANLRIGKSVRIGRSYLADARAISAG